jgi:hypothetical protein
MTTVGRRPGVAEPDEYLDRLDARIRRVHGETWNDEAGQKYTLAGLVAARNLYAHPGEERYLHAAGLAEALDGSQQPVRRLPQPAGPGEVQRELARLRFIENQVRALAGEWHEDSGPEDTAVVSCANQVEDVLAAAGTGIPVDHLAEIERHVAALRAEMEIPKRCRHAWESGPWELQKPGTDETCLLGCRTIRRRSGDISEGVHFVYPENIHG